MRTLTQDEIERHCYESRDMACRDALSWERHMERQQQQIEQQQQELERAKQEADKALRSQIIDQIALCEQLLHRPTTPEEQFLTLPLDELQTLAARLRQELVEPA